MLSKVTECNMVVDSRIKPVVAVHSGAKIETIRSKLERLVDHNDNLSACIVHVGTNNLGKTSAEEMLRQYKKIEKLLHERVPSCTVFFSSILPRMDSLLKNLQAIEVNTLLADMCSKNENCSFIDNTELFFANGEFRKDLYGKYDGLHINKDGGAVLAENFWKSLNACQFRNVSRRRRCFNCGSIVHVRKDCKYNDYAFCTICGRYGHRNVNCHWYSV